MYFSIAAASTWWFIYSRPDRFEVYANEPSQTATVARVPRWRWVPPAGLIGHY
jgi:hypothetical protein